MNFYYTKNTIRGFTLIEVLVSLSIFTIVVTIAVSTLLVLIDANTRAQNTQSIMTNLSFALDSMTREIRTGSDYYCRSDGFLPDDGTAKRNCDGETRLTFNEGGNSLTEGTGSSRIGYRLQNNRLQRRLGLNTGAGWKDVTSPDIIIDELRFYVTGSQRNDNLTPTVTVYLKGAVGDEINTRSEFVIQTTITQQLVDI